jgi:hypothetical protein
VGLRIINHFEMRSPTLSKDGKTITYDFIDADTREQYLLPHRKEEALKFAEQVIKLSGLEITGKMPR